MGLQYITLMIKIILASHIILYREFLSSERTWPLDNSGHGSYTHIGHKVGCAQACYFGHHVRSVHVPDSNIQHVCADTTSYINMRTHKHAAASERYISLVVSMQGISMHPDHHHSPDYRHCK